MSLLFFTVPNGNAATIDADTITAYPSEAGTVSPKKKLLSYTTIAKVETLFLKSLELAGKLDEDGNATMTVNYEFTIADEDETDFGTRSYDVDITIEDAEFRNLSVSIDPEFTLREETEQEYVFTRKSLICADRIVLRGMVDAHQYAFIRNDVPLPEDDNETDFFDEYSFNASGYSDAKLTLKGTTCIPIDINIRIDKATGRETYEHAIIPLYRNQEAAQGTPETELIDPVFTEASFAGIDIPVFLIPEEYAASVIAATLDEFLNEELLKAIAEEIFVLDLPPALDFLFQNMQGKGRR